VLPPAAASPSAWPTGVSVLLQPSSSYHSCYYFGRDNQQQHGGGFASNNAETLRICTGCSSRGEKHEYEEAEDGTIAQ
jgi:hypothetical protein